MKNIKYKLINFSGLIFIILLWYLFTKFNLVPSFILPSPKQVFIAFIKDFKIIFWHLQATILEALLGLLISIFIAFALAVLMDKFKILNKIISPILIVSQSIPTISIAPLIVLWFGFGLLPKVILIFITCFFPILISILTGFKNVDIDLIKFLKSLNASYFQILFYVKIPYSLTSFFSGLKIATTYSVVGAVIAEWLGGERGIGVYMTRVKMSYSFDKMFASIIVISIVSIFFVFFINKIEKILVYWDRGKQNEKIKK